MNTPRNCSGSGRRIRAGSTNIVLVLAWLVLLIFIGAGSYFVVSQFVLKRQPGPKAEPTTEANPLPTEPDRPATIEPTGKDDAAAREKAEQEARKEADRQQREAERMKLEAEKKRAEQKEKERLEQIAREEQRKKEEEAKIAAEKLQALKRNPPALALEDIDGAPDRYQGQFFAIDRVAIKLSAIDKHKELGKYTLGVTSERGTYYSRVPLGGLIVSTGDKLGLNMLKQIDGTDNFFRYKIYCEVRKWGKKETARTWPEVYIYRLEAFDRMGNMTRVMEE